MQNLTASQVSDRDEYLHFISLDSSLGFALTAVSPRGICAILMGDTREELERELRREFPRRARLTAIAVLRVLARRL